MNCLQNSISNHALHLSKRENLVFTLDFDQAVRHSKIADPLLVILHALIFLPHMHREYKLRIRILQEEIKSVNWYSPSLGSAGTNAILIGFPLSFRISC